MANEININGACSISSAGQTVQGTSTFQASLGGGGFLGNEQTIGTVAEVLVIGDVSTPTVVFVKNLDPDNFVEVDSASTMDKFPQKLFPGYGVTLFPETGVIYCKANTAACKVWAVVG